MNEELSCIAALADGDFITFYRHNDRASKWNSGYTLEWAQQAYNLSQWAPRMCVVGIDLANGPDYSVVNGEVIRNDRTRP